MPTLPSSDPVSARRSVEALGPALITGASAGLGREFATQLAQRGRDLVLVARDAFRLQEVASELSTRFGSRCEVLPADLTEDAGLAEVRRRLARGDVELLVNNAGFGTTGSMARVSLPSQEAMLRLHVMVPNALCHAALPEMLQRSRGAIINVSSVASYLASAGNANYCASKGYLRMFSEAVALEVQGRGVIVQALCPGYTHTEFHSRGAMNMSHVPKFLWLDATRVVRESLEAIDRGGPVVVIPSRRYRLIVFLLRHAPGWLRIQGARRHQRTGAKPH